MILLLNYGNVVCDSNIFTDNPPSHLCESKVIYEQPLNIGKIRMRQEKKNF